MSAYQIEVFRTVVQRGDFDAARRLAVEYRREHVYKKAVQYASKSIQHMEFLSVVFCHAIPYEKVTTVVAADILFDNHEFGASTAKPKQFKYWDIDREIKRIPPTVVSCILAGNLEKLQIIFAIAVEHGFEVDFPISYEGVQYSTPLLCAVVYGTAGIVEWLLQNGADVTQHLMFSSGLSESAWVLAKKRRPREQKIVDLLEAWAPAGRTIKSAK